MLKETVRFIDESTNNFQPQVGIILGSGLGDFAQEFENISVPYSSIPGFEQSTVQGHKSQLVFAEVAGKKVVMMQGRFHFYEGHPMEKVVYPIKVMKKLGVNTLIVTNAAGAINTDFRPADLMIITDHLNFMGTNPLIGANDESLGDRFPDMSEVYKKYLVEIAEKSAQELQIEVRKGVYAANTGPSYETPTEVKMLRMLGADAIGMSTVPEAIVANYCGMDVLGISCISNAASGVGEAALSHEEVIETTNIAKSKFKSLLLKVLEKI
jgi:purine-nucleoside phosphorylase